MPRPEQILDDLADSLAARSMEPDLADVVDAIDCAAVKAFVTSRTNDGDKASWLIHELADDLDTRVIDDTPDTREVASWLALSSLISTDGQKTLHELLRRALRVSAAREVLRKVQARRLFPGLEQRRPSREPVSADRRALAREHNAEIAR